MTGHTRVPRTEITGVYGAVLKRFSRKMFGQVPEALEVMWHHRQVLSTSMGMGRRAAKWHECDDDLKSYAHMAVAALVGCSFCLDLGYFQAHNNGLDEVKAQQVPRWRESDVFTPLERCPAAAGAGEPGRAGGCRRAVPGRGARRRPAGPTGRARARRRPGV
ncbi:carboxymuconolactone decarboxylase family protein [Actinoplanes sp. NPDC048967]|uniref:carboxymuconolactone decarboxylase family protein n=1 Tax=Actinoplanes sp. NPDC048967 TaxID=3155269 RepID=UPI0033E7102A